MDETDGGIGMESLAERLEKFAEKHAELLTYGPKYDRSVRSFFADAMVLGAQGREAEAEYWYSLAVGRVELLAAEVSS